MAMKNAAPRRRPDSRFFFRYFSVSQPPPAAMHAYIRV